MLPLRSSDAAHLLGEIRSSLGLRLHPPSVSQGAPERARIENQAGITQLCVDQFSEKSICEASTHILMGRIVP